MVGACCGGAWYAMKASCCCVLTSAWQSGVTSSHIATMLPLMVNMFALFACYIATKLCVTTDRSLLTVAFAAPWYGAPLAPHVTRHMLYACVEYTLNLAHV